MGLATVGSSITLAELALWLDQQTWSEFAQSLADQYGNKGTLSEKQEAAARSMHAKVTAKQAAKKAEVKAIDLTEGIYVGNDGETVYKVQSNLAGTSLYAKELVAKDDGNGYGWIYVGKAPLYDLTEANLMTAETASALGHKLGACVFCARLLTTAESTTVGYGPVCAAKHGLPWGATNIEEVGLFA